MADLVKVRVRYRLAKLVNAQGDEADGEHPLETAIRTLYSGVLGKDVSKRILKIPDEERHSLCLHTGMATKAAFVFDLLHLDDRTEVPLLLRPTSPAPLGTLSRKKLGKNEVSLHEPAYVMVHGNHVAMVERIGVRTGAVENYLNELIDAVDLLPASYRWKLIPRIESVGIKALSGGVEKIVLKPRAAIVGEAEPAPGTPTRERSYTRKVDEFISHGGKILDALRVFGANEADIEKLRQKMSSDLVLKARVEIRVSKAERGSDARVSADDVSKAFAAVTETSDIEILDRDGRTNGKLTQLSHDAEVEETNGIIDMKHATNVLGAALQTWAARGAIDLS